MLRIRADWRTLLGFHLASTGLPEALLSPDRELQHSGDYQNG
jgi:hypothetical protein